MIGFGYHKQLFVIPKTNHLLIYVKYLVLLPPLNKYNNF